MNSFVIALTVMAAASTAQHMFPTELHAPVESAEEYEQEEEHENLF